MHQLVCIGHLQLARNTIWAGCFELIYPFAVCSGANLRNWGHSVVRGCGGLCRIFIVLSFKTCMKDFEFPQKWWIVNDYATLFCLGGCKYSCWMSVCNIHSSWMFSTNLCCLLVKFINAKSKHCRISFGWNCIFALLMAHRKLYLSSLYDSHLSVKNAKFLVLSRWWISWFTSLFYQFPLFLYKLFAICINSLFSNFYSWSGWME